METKNKKTFETQKLDDERRVRVLSPGMLVFKRFVRNKLAITGLIILVVMFAFAFLGGLFSPYGQSQVFKRDEEIMKEYATCMQSTDFRYTIREGAVFPDAARAQAALAISKGATSFTYDNKTYSLVKEGEAVQKRTSRTANEAMTEIKDRATGTWDKLEQVFEDRVARL